MQQSLWGKGRRGAGDGQERLEDDDEELEEGGEKEGGRRRNRRKTRGRRDGGGNFSVIFDGLLFSDIHNMSEITFACTLKRRT